MLVAWMLYAMVSALGIVAAAAVIDRLVRGLGWPTRWIWFSAVVLALSLPVLMAAAEGGPETHDGVPGSSVSHHAGIAAPGAVLASEQRRDVFQRIRFLLPRRIDVAYSPALADAGRVIAALWLVATALGFAWLICTDFWLSRHVARCRAEIVERQAVVVSARIGPGLAGVTRCRIVLPEWVLRLDARSRQLILLHEWEHIRARDPLLLRCALLLVLLAPWNVCLWYMMRRLRRSAELDCDARVLRLGRDRRAYGHLLLSVAERVLLRRAPLASFAVRGSLLSMRIRSLNAEPVPASLPRTLLYCGCAFLLFVGACGTPRPVSIRPVPPDPSAGAAGHPAPNNIAADPRGTAEWLRQTVVRQYPRLLRSDRGEEVLVRVIFDAGGDVVRIERSDGPVPVPLSNREALAVFHPDELPSPIMSGLQLVSTGGRRVVVAWAMPAPPTL